MGSNLHCSTPSYVGCNCIGTDYSDIVRSAEGSQTDGDSQNDGDPEAETNGWTDTDCTPQAQLAASEIASDNTGPCSEVTTCADPHVKEESWRVAVVLGFISFKVMVVGGCPCSAPFATEEPATDSHPFQSEITITNSTAVLNKVISVSKLVENNEHKTL